MSYDTAWSCVIQLTKEAKFTESIKEGHLWLQQIQSQPTTLSLSNTDRTLNMALTHRTVNLHGKPGYGKPIDQMIEHYNL